VTYVMWTCGLRLFCIKVPVLVQGDLLSRHRATAAQSPCPPSWSLVVGAASSSASRRWWCEDTRQRLRLRLQSPSSFSKFDGYRSSPPGKPWLPATSCFKCFRCFSCFRRLFQIFDLDILKTDLGVAHVARLHTHVSNTCFKCFICFKLML